MCRIYLSCKLFIYLGMLALGFFSTGFAASIAVTTTADENDLLGSDLCSLREAVISISEGYNYGGCNAPDGYSTGTHTISLPGGIYILNLNGSFFPPLPPGFGHLLLSKNITIQASTSNIPTISSDFQGLSGSCGVFEVESGASVILRNLTITSAWEKVRRGGAICNQGTLTLDKVSVENSQAIEGGGIYNTGNLMITKSVIHNNLAEPHPSLSIASESYSGGGIFNDGGTVLIKNSTLSGNEAYGSGGGIFNQSGSVDLQYVTISTNLANTGPASDNGTGGGIRNVAGEVSLSHTILAGNFNSTDTNTAGSDCAGTLESEGHNLIGTLSTVSSVLDTCATESGLSATDIFSFNESIDPDLGALSFNGGTTRTHRLLEDSPAIDKGSLISATCQNAASNTPACEDQRAQARFLDGDGINGQESDIGAYEIQGEAEGDLSITGTVSANSVATGGLLTYTFEASNSGPNDATDVLITFRALHDQNSNQTIELIESSANCSTSDEYINCSLGTLEAGSQTTRFLTIKHNITDPIFNSETQVFAFDDPNYLNNWVGFSVLVNPSADLELISPGSTNMFLNKAFSRLFTLSNNGPYDATGVNFRTNFEIAKGGSLEYLGFESSKEDVSCAFATTTPTGRPLECSIGDLASGETVTVRLFLKTPTQNSEQTLRSFVSSSLADPDESNNSLTMNFVSSEIGPPVDLDGFTMLSIRDRPELIAEPFDYGLVLTNLSPNEATDVLVGVRATELSFISASLDGEPQTCNLLKSGIIACELDNIKANSSALLELKLDAPPTPSTVSIEAIVESALAEKDLTNNSVSVRKDFRAPAADLQVTRAGLREIPLNGKARYDFSVTNLGPDTASGITLQYISPKSFKRGVLPRACGTTADGMIGCAIPTLKPGETLTFSANIAATEKGTFRDEVRVISRSSDPVSSNNTVLGSIEVQEAQLATDLSLDVLGQISLRPNERFEQTLHVVVNSNRPAQNVVLEGTLASNLKYLSNDAGCTVNGQSIRCTLGEMEAGSEKQITLSLNASTTLGTATSQFTLSTDTPDENSNNDSLELASIILAATPEADLSIDLSGPSMTKTASDIAYLLTLTNASSNALNNVSAVLDLPETLSFVSAEGCQKENKLIICITSLAANESREFSLTLKAPTSETEVTLSATITAQAIDPDDSNNQDSVTTRTTTSDVTVPMIKASANLASLSNVDLNAGSSNVSALAFTLSNPLNEGVKVKTITLSSSGSGNDNLDLTAVKLYTDINNSGKQDAGDTLLGTGSFSQDNGDLTLVLNTPVELSANTNQSFAVTVDINNQLAHILGGSLFSFLALGYIGLKRRRTLSLTAAILVCIVLASCNSVQAPSSDPKTYELRLSRVNAEMVQGGGFVPADGTPLRGITLTVQ